MGTAITFITPSEFRKFKFIQRVAKTDIRKENVPAAKEVISVRRKRLENQLLAIMTNNADNDLFLSLARKMLESHDSDQVLASVLNHFYKDALDESKYKDLTPTRRDRNRDMPSKFNRDEDDNGYVRLFIARGRKDGLDKRELISYLSKKTKSSSEDIQDVTVRDEFSFVSAPYEVAERIISIINKGNTSDRPIVTRAKPDNPNGKHLSRNKRSSSRRSERRRPAPSRRGNDEQPYGRDSYSHDDWDTSPRNKPPKKKKYGQSNKKRSRY